MPPDARRSCACIYYDAKAPLEQIKYILGHDKLDTTAKYVNDEQKFGEGAVTKVVDISEASTRTTTINSPDELLCWLAAT